MNLTGNKLTAEDGKVLRRKADGMVYGDVIYLGNTYYIGGILQNPPHVDVMDDFEEVEKPKELKVDDYLDVKDNSL